MNIFERVKLEISREKKKFTYRAERKRGSLKMIITRVFQKPMDKTPVINFEEAEIEVKFTNSTGEEFTLNTLLPQGWKLIERQKDSTGNTGNCVTQERTIYIDRYILLSTDESADTDSVVQKGKKGDKEYNMHEGLEVDGGVVFSILHELGHAWDYEGMSKYEKELSNNANRLYTSRVILNKEPEIPDEFVELFKDNVLQEERDAWVYALRVLRELKKEGFDLEPNLTNTEIIKKVKEALNSYHQNDPRMKSSKRK